MKFGTKAATKGKKTSISFNITERQTSELKRLAKKSGLLEAEILRRGLDRELDDLNGRFEYSERRRIFTGGANGEVEKGEAENA